MSTLARLRPFLLYAGSIALGKGLTLITLPMLAHGLPPADFVRLDFAASILEPIGLLAGFALADCLFRFAQGDAAAQAAAMERFLGMGMILAGLLVASTQFLLIPALAGLPNLPGEGALRAILLSACLGGFIELPLAYLRLAGRPGAFFLFVATRALAQATSLVLGLHLGFGVDGILIGNAAIDIAIILALLLSLPGGTRPVISAGTMRQDLGYAFPLVLGAFAMFALGACDRWFLVANVTPETLAHYAIAAKLALALALATQPFALWWYPRRLGVLTGPDGRAETARFWALGVLVIGAGMLGVMLAAKALVMLFLPPAYVGALRWLPALLAIAALNELASLSNGVSYAHAHGGRVLAINGAGAGVAILLYLVLIPALGVSGAILATLCGQGLRLALFLADRHEGARLGYPLIPAAGFLGGALLAAMMIAGAIPATLPALGIALALVAASGLMLAGQWRPRRLADAVP